MTDTIADMVRAHETRLAEHEAALVVGARVRIARRECDSHWHAGMNWDGAVGIINDIESAEDEAQHAEPQYRGHRFFVYFWDDAGSFFAASELVPLADDAREDG